MRPLTLLLMPLLLAGCSKSIDLHDATIDQFAKAAGSADLQKPGMWSMDSRVTAMDLGSTDPVMATVIRQQAMQPQTSSVCVVKGKPNPMSFANVPAFKTMACHVPRFTAKGGSIDGQITCNSPVGSTTMDERGQYAAETYSLEMRIKQMVQGQPTITTTTQVEAHRVGDCAG